MEVLLLLVMFVINTAWFLLGVKFGKQVAKYDEVKLPAVKPTEPVEEHQAQNEAEQEAVMDQRQLEAILQNIDNYDGTDEGQVDVPWR